MWICVIIFHCKLIHIYFHIFYYLSMTYFLPSYILKICLEFISANTGLNGSQVKYFSFKSQFPQSCWFTLLSLTLCYESLPFSDIKYLNTHLMKWPLHDVSFLFKISLYFNLRIITLQNFVVFCQTSAWISHRYTYIPSLLNLPPIPPL